MSPIERVLGNRRLTKSDRVSLLNIYLEGIGLESHMAGMLARRFLRDHERNLAAQYEAALKKELAA